MALLDVSEVLLDPDFTTTFSVVRRTESISTHGRSVLTPVTTNNVVGVITAGASQLDRRPDMQVMPRAITIVTKFRLIGEVVSKQPDIVQWAGDNYLVKLIDYYPQYGEGFVQAECEATNLVDLEPA